MSKQSGTGGYTDQNMHDAFNRGLEEGKRLGFAGAYPVRDKRFQAAVAAMQGLVAAWGSHDNHRFDDVAADAVGLADALLKALEEK